jgi:predicted nucleic acid-binding protein
VALTRRVVLDTSAYSHLRSGHEALHLRLEQAQEIVIPVVVLGELHAAFRGGKRLLDNEAVLERFLEEPFVSVAEVDREVAERYGEVFAQLKRQGTPIPTNDVWIAAATLTCGGHLLSFDDDFSRVPGLRWTRFHAPKR